MNSQISKDNRNIYMENSVRVHPPDHAPPPQFLPPLGWQVAGEVRCINVFTVSSTRNSRKRSSLESNLVLFIVAGVHYWQQIQGDATPILLMNQNPSLIAICLLMT